ATDGQLGGAHLRAQVAEIARQTVVGGERVEHVASFAPLIEHLDDGPANALAPDVAGRDVVTAGDRAAGVSVVALDARNEDQPTVGEDRCEEIGRASGRERVWIEGRGGGVEKKQGGNG